MQDMTTFSLGFLDYLAFGAFFVVLSLVGYFAGRKERGNADDYFLAGRNLPWYVVGGSFIASNISTEHFIAMIGAAFVYGICVADSEWMNVISFSLIIWLFIPFLMASKIFTMPEYLERSLGHLWWSQICGMDRFFYGNCYDCRWPLCNRSRPKNVGR